MSKAERELFAIYLRLELKRLLLVNRILNANDYANIRAYCTVLNNSKGRECMYNFAKQKRYGGNVRRF